MRQSRSSGSVGGPSGQPAALPGPCRPRRHSECTVLEDSQGDTPYAAPRERPKAATVSRPSRSRFPPARPQALRSSAGVVISPLSDWTHHHPEAVAFGALTAATVAVGIVSECPESGADAEPRHFRPIFTKRAREDRAQRPWSRCRRS